MSILKTEIDTDPLTRGYAGMSDQQVADSLNTANRDNWVSLSASQIFEAIDRSEFTALSAGDQGRIDRILGLGSGIQTAPGSQARDEMIAVFGGGSTTISNLLAVANPMQTRGQELGIGIIRVGQVTEARTA